MRKCLIYNKMTIHIGKRHLFRKYNELVRNLTIPEMPIGNTGADRFIRDMIMGKKACLACCGLDACKSTAMKSHCLPLARCSIKSRTLLFLYVEKHKNNAKRQTLYPSLWVLGKMRNDMKELWSNHGVALSYELAGGKTSYSCFNVGNDEVFVQSCWVISEYVIRCSPITDKVRKWHRWFIDSRII